VAALATTAPAAAAPRANGLEDVGYGGFIVGPFIGGGWRSAGLGADCWFGEGRKLSGI
jgi:hypothetical protein